MLKKLIQTGAILLMLLLAACGSSSNNAAAPPQPEQGEESAPENVEAAPADEATEAEVLPVAAKPQFIEFYADW